jgi:hypothetical protein
VVGVPTIQTFLKISYIKRLCAEGKQTDKLITLFLSKFLEEHTLKKTFAELTKVAYKALKVLIDFQATKVLLI